MTELTAAPGLHLRPVAKSDRACLHRHWNDLAAGRFLWDGRPVSRATVARLIGQSRADFARAGYGLWCVLYGEPSAFAGVCGLRQ